MKKLKIRNEYYASNVRYYADKKEAYSYDWWCFVKVINGKTIFNNYTYSSTTCRHQSKVASLMYKLGHKIDLYVDMNYSLTEESFKDCALHSFYRKVISNIIQNNSPRTRQKTIKKNSQSNIKIKKQILKLKNAGAEITWSFIYKTYRELKRERDLKLKAIAEYKKKNIYRSGNNTRWTIIDNNTSSGYFRLESIDTRDKRDVYYYDSFFLNFKPCLLSNALEN